jgi:hypothetical protein
LRSNESIRAFNWYEIEHDELAQLDNDIATNWDRVQELFEQMHNNPRKCLLYPLDRDPEWQHYYGTRPPNFYPRARGCSADVDYVARNIVPNLLRQINAVPRNVAGRFSTMYDSWICSLEACGFPDSEIQPLRDKYNDLQGITGGSPRGSMRCVCPPPGVCACPPSPIPDNCP